MKRDACLPTGTPPAGPRKPQAIHRGYEIFAIIGEREVVYRKPGTAGRRARSVASAMTAIDKLEGRSQARQAEPDPYENWTYRIGADAMSLEVSRKIVEARQKKHRAIELPLDQESVKVPDGK